MTTQVRLLAGGWILQALICGFMAFGPKPALADTSSRIAVLETRSDQIDQHLTSTDSSVQRLWVTVEAQGNQQAEMQGEERAAFGILTLLTAGNFVVQIRSRRKEQ
jgi:hypothetical protein